MPAQEPIATAGKTRERLEPQGGLVHLYGFGPLRGGVPDTFPWRGGTCESLREALARAAPRLAPWLAHCLVAVDGKPLAPGSPIWPDQHVELLPPVSGG